LPDCSGTDEAVFERAKAAVVESAGRKRRKEITAVHPDWKQGMRGLQLYRKHIPGYDNLAQWRRKAKSRALMDAIRTRQRREKQRSDSPYKLDAEQIGEHPSGKHD
jgi:hypothetical protein